MIATLVFVIPAKAGIQLKHYGRGIISISAADAAHWVPAFAGMTSEDV
jgi:hypothetical protein